MSEISPAWTMVGMDILMIVYTLWVLSLAGPPAGKGVLVGIPLLIWLGILHLVLSSQSILPHDISGPAFLAAIFGAVGAVGALLLLVAPVRNALLGLDQRQLMLLHGVRVFFGATFLMWASTGVLTPVSGTMSSGSSAGLQVVCRRLGSR